MIHCGSWGLAINAWLFGSIRNLPGEVRKGGCHTIDDHLISVIEQLREEYHFLVVIMIRHISTRFLDDQWACDWDGLEFNMRMIEISSCLANVWVKLIIKVMLSLSQLAKPEHFSLSMWNHKSRWKFTFIGHWLACGVPSLYGAADWLRPCQCCFFGKRFGKISDGE